MKNLSKLVLAVVFFFALTISVAASNTNYDYSVSDTTYNSDEVQELKLAQDAKAKEFSNSLGLCKSLSYETKLNQGKEKNTIIAETARECDQIVGEKEEEGYTAISAEKKHEPAVVTYFFNILNNIITSGTINDSTTEAYNGKNVSEVATSTEFADFEDDDVVITNEITNESHEVSGSEILTTRNEANTRRNELRGQGFTANVVQNNTQTTTETITLPNRLNAIQLVTRANQLAAEKNPNKEVLVALLLPNPIIGNNAVVEDTNAASLDEANSIAAEKEATGEYGSVEVVTNVDTDKSHATLVSEGNEGEWDEGQTGDEYDEDLEVNGVPGYRHHYKVSERRVINEEIREFTGVASFTQCLLQINNYRNQGYSNVACTLAGLGRTVMTGDIEREEAVPYYDDYTYGELYLVRATNYRYNFTYLATDYTVNYNGTEGTMQIVKSSADKYYEIELERAKYTVNTTGTINEDTLCLNPKTVNTGANEGLLYEIMAVLGALGLTTIFVRRFRKSN